ncbi:penicillin acylase family protein [Marilutibacter spongiae]|uniref:Penicillin acylase family protein n=1 Tax=Marilutibacter spongiae TaxID=2025720 RepID=A0A7W3Y5X8_9GAMM|nr:penicillin acylase family protein [Lysobacter spongiae]MBB1060450.1 penicillin acylase family protein [Lysobacter spongiae]
MYRMYSRYPLVVRLVLLVVLPALLAIGYGYWLLARSLPLVEGQASVEGLRSRVVVERDRHGVPTITAASDHDAFFALGYAHAQDRLWQLELQRRIAGGRLSEVFGKQSVQQDIWFRTLGLERAAHASWSSLGGEARASLQAYADGVNQYLASGHPLPPEFLLLGIEPEPWTVYDSLAWAKVFALNLAGNQSRELERLVAGQAFDARRMALLFPEYEASGATSQLVLAPGDVDAYARMSGFQASLEEELRIGGRFVGSNAWAVSGRVTGAGALLANDPHLGLQIPSLWYMASLKGDRLDASGATLVGLPVVIFGRNQSIAWGGTNLMADVQDLYFEQPRTDDPTQYRAGEAWLRFQSRTESIQVRQDFPEQLRGPLRPVEIRVRASRHGPIVSDLFQALGQPAALRWTGLDDDDTSYESFLRLNYASDWSDFEEALRHHVVPALNMLYADRHGNIGMLSAGRIPVRSEGDGTIPVPGWTDAHDWTGHVPFEALPRAYNPPSGFLVSANNKPVDAAYPYLISKDWAPPGRADRITLLLEEAIGAGKPVDLSTMARIQADEHSEPALALLARLLEHEPNNDAQRTAFAHLREWNGSMDAASPAATIFNEWTRQVRKTLLADDTRGYWNAAQERRVLQALAQSVGPQALRQMLDDPTGAWCDNRGTPDERESCDEVIDVALDRALRELAKLESDDSMDDWAWGDVHRTLYRHVPFSDSRLLKRVFERRIGAGGTPDTVNVASFEPDPSGNGYVQDFGAGFRQLFAMTPARVRHLYMNSTGQSGHLLSGHYDDMVEPFRDVDFLEMGDAGGVPASTLELLPRARASAATGTSQ